MSQETGPAGGSAGFDECGTGRLPVAVSAAGAGSYTHDAVNATRSAHKEAKKHHLVELYENYADYDSRLNTYPSTLPEGVPHKRLLAEAGFIWRGDSGPNGAIDQTQCFWCGLNLENWEKDDDPWVEHAKNMQTCKFVIMMKGANFIKDCTQSNGSHGNSTDNMDTAT